MDIDVYIAGMSNTDAIRDALRSYQGQTKFFIDRLDPKSDGTGYVGGAPDPEYFKGKINSKLVALSLWGSWYNTLALIEHPEPFDFIYPQFDETFREDRRLIPFNQIRQLFNDNIRQRLSAVKVIRDLTASKVVLIDSPPPIEDEEHIRKYPGPFQDEIGAGITPPQIRLKMWKLQSDIYAAVASENRVDFMGAPEETVSDDGFLKPDYCFKDPTHGNARYGSLLLSQLEATHRTLA